VTRPAKTKTGKTVRIISPHSATSDTGAGVRKGSFDSSRFLPSLPPPETASPTGSPDEPLEDPFGADSDGGGSTEDEGTRLNTIKNQGGSYNPTVPILGVPFNPFKKTLGTLESKSLGAEQTASIDEPKPNKPTYDVDDFKKLLLTGEKSLTAASASTAPPVTFQSSAAIGDNSSNTDTSSISRHSIFEPASSPLQETPHTSQENLPSDDERQQPVENAPKTEKSRPSTPRHRYGKPVKAGAPTTVSFEDPAFSFSDFGENSQRRPNVGSPATPVDADKPLPSLPSGFHHKPESDGILSNALKQQEPTLEPQRSASGSKRNPPPPPLSRRHSQLKPRNPDYAGQPSPLSAEPTSDPTLFSSSPPTSTTKGPLPPRPRKSGLARGNSSSSTNTNASTALPQDPTNAVEASPSPKPRPPAPPTRSPNLAATKRPPQPASSSPSMAPPPPPRRRGSSQSSYTPSRLSGNFSNAAGSRFRSDSGASSISQFQMTSPEPQIEKKDIMADLSALQREVDELRGKFKE